MLAIRTRTGYRCLPNLSLSYRKDGPYRKGSEMQSITRFVSRATVLATTFGAAVALASGPAAASVSTKGWSPQCDWGKACIRLASDAGRWWNMNNCGYNPINDRYSWGKAHGNSFTVTYVNGTWDRVEAWTERPLDGNNTVIRVDVHC